MEAALVQQLPAGFSLGDLSFLLSDFDIALWAEGTGVALLFGEGEQVVRHGDDLQLSERPWPSKVGTV